MSVIRFCADLHLGHKNIAERRGFSSVEEHDNFIIGRWNEVVTKRDCTWILGDITMETKEHYHLLDKMNGMKRVILGNHDSYKHVPELLKHVLTVGALVRHKGVFLSHCPVHPRELEYRVPYNVHGHIHDAEVGDPRYICVSLERIDYRPKTLGELIPNWDDKKHRTKVLEDIRNYRETLNKRYE